ncbi:uncharacterized protein KD926_009076 [Aspergillus affinis]|uniref:uncharacterized protein n=1 Tax=Aspergillus affinis TaxID=1070780 RepID=UPI0022FDF9CB|nr:uncharacterized protein KD926_009076 [Aspergillus affinis]KAI9039733.1 hypothetical protein KD926_009076 [Aspergillus affinis]
MKNNLSRKTDFCTTPESSFSYHNLQRRYGTRRHSFRVPDLPAIPSSCSGSSDESELGSSYPPSSRKLAKEDPNNNRARRESCDEEISSYLLSLAAQAAERQLKEQALAAFPNEQVYQPVDHFAIDNEDEDCSPDDGVTIPGQLHHLDSRRNSAADLSSELECLRVYKQRAGIRALSKIGTDGNCLPRSESLSRHPASHGRSMNAEISGNLVENGCHESPPMLGTDLIFPQSLSPETTIYEGGSSVKPTDITHNNPGLWHALPHQNDRTNEGLWMGTCQNDRRAEVKHVPINTMPETISVPTNKIPTFIPADLRTENSLAVANEAELRDTVMDEEDAEPYPSDDFVTQIYNYLSLGYPCVARYYDHELSKISGISVADLRQDDIDTDAKGFVFTEERGIKRDKKSNGCRRWRALRLYIHEWDTERPRVPEEDGNHEKWGVRERRGSWAV